MQSASCPRAPRCLMVRRPATQGMATAEIITELGPQSIGQESIANEPDVLVQAKKISSPGREGKYLPAASEVPTAPDQPSS
jgi:hypothetical protein